MKSCAKKSTCLAVVTPQKLDDYSVSMLKDVARANRAISIAVINVAKAELQNTDINTEGPGPYVQAFFKPAKGEKTEEDEPKKINSKVVDYSGAFTSSALSAFIGNAKPEDAKPITRAIILKTKADPVAAKKKRDRKKARDAARKASRKAKRDKAPPSPKPKARPAPKKKITIEDEREARRRMDAEMNNVLVDDSAPAEDEVAANEDSAGEDDGAQDSIYEDFGDEDDEDGDEDDDEAEEIEEEEEEIEEEEEEEEEIEEVE